METRQAAIERVVRDYIEGWYTCDENRMRKALHPDLAKRGRHAVPSTGRSNLVHVSASNMVEYTRAGLGRLEDGAEPGISIKVLQVSGNTASAVAISLKCIDHIHLVYGDGRWSIVNVLWEPVEECLQ